LESQGCGRRSFDVRSRGVLNVDLPGPSAEGRQFARKALPAWEAVAGITFSRDPGLCATIHITFGDYGQDAVLHQ